MTFTDIDNNVLKLYEKQVFPESAPLLNNFSCGNTVLDDIFKNECANDFSSVTKIIVNAQSEEIICVYSLCCASMILENHNKHYPAPAVEIKYFAINTKYQDIKSKDKDDGCLSSVILYDLMAQILFFTDEICGANFVFLYSTEEGESFYRKCGFVDFPIDVWRDDSRFLDGCIPLCFKLR